MTFFAPWTGFRFGKKLVENYLIYFKKCLICRGLYPSDSSSNYMTVSREYVQKLEYRIEELRIDLYKNKEVSC